MDIDNTINRRMPYMQLERLGINREAAHALPEDFKTRLCNGELTPLVRVVLTASNGTKVAIPLRLQLTGDLDNNPNLKVYPAKADLSERTTSAIGLSPYESDRLRQGQVILKAIEKDGLKKTMFLQLDPETKSVIAKNLTDVKINNVVQNIEKIKDIQLGTQQKQQALEGKPIELNVGGEKVSVGVDLREPQGFKIMKGDMEEWNRQKQMKYDIVHPEYIGLVQTDKNRWEYQQVVNKQSVDRAIKLGAHNEKNTQGLKL